MLDYHSNSIFIENESDKQALDAFLKSLAILAETRDYVAVAAPFTDLGFKNLEEENEGATFRVYGNKIYNAVIHLDRDPEPPFAAKQVVVAIALLFEPGTVVLSDIQNIFGDWYRDPVDGERAALATSYFNPRVVAPTADYFLYANTTEDYVEMLSLTSPIESIGTTWRDDRYNTENRPW